MVEWKGLLRMYMLNLRIILSIILTPFYYMSKEGHKALV